MDEISDYEGTYFKRVIAGLRQEGLTPNQSRELFEDLTPGLVGGDLAFVHNMGLLAAQAGLTKEAYSIGMDMIENGHPGSTVAIAARGLDATLRSDPTVFHEMLSAASNIGHLRARSLLWGLRLRKLGMLGFIVLIPIRLGLTSRGFAIALNNPDDVRLDAVPNRNPS